ncbi:Crp/Fnr family transcriptional regulator [Comamonas sp. E6]|uniref:Crp/Fnr family transcriptional regulator n=1 Tax=Comamonas sp. E6 TaxID=364029 RepID=UPI000632952E|nr:Crp/Fnr family transcriptional regulator [Comamonas sp. E6]GAO73631.1 Crp/Fnr family transcriptional regulator [Comamonas sp. E6]
MTRLQRVRTPSLTLEELLTQSAWFTALDESTRALVRAEASEHAVSQGESIGRYGEHQHAWYGVLEGLIKWSVTSADGRSITLGGQSVGSWFGEGSIIRDQPRQADLIALRHSRIAMIPHSTFAWLRRNSPVFNEFLLQQVNDRLHWFMGNYVAQHLLDTPSQVARALVGLVHPLLNPRGEMYLLLSQEELANLAAVSRQSCNSALSRFKSQGLIKSEYGGIVVLDLPGLQKLAQ